MLKTFCSFLLHGSNPTDRDENAKKDFHRFISNIMKTIADHLVNNGLASYKL